MKKENENISTINNQKLNLHNIIDEAIAETWDELGEGFENITVTQEEVVKQVWKDIVKTAISTGSGGVKIKLYNLLLENRYGISISNNNQIKEIEEEEMSLPFDLNIQKERI